MSIDTNCPDCAGCPTCDHPDLNKPLVFLGCCFKWDSVNVKDEKGQDNWQYGENINALLALLALDCRGLIWNYRCGDDTGEKGKGKCRTVITMDICQLKHLLKDDKLKKALNLIESDCQR